MSLGGFNSSRNTGESHEAIRSWSLTVLLAVVLVSCSTSTSFQLASKRLPQAPAVTPVDPAHVQLLKERPLDYAVVGEIRAELVGYKWREDVIHDRALATAMRAEAARMGANAVIEMAIIDHEMGGNHSRWGDPANGEAKRPTALVATAIRTAP